MDDLEFWKQAYLIALKNSSMVDDDGPRVIADQAVANLKAFKERRLMEYQGRPD